MDPFETLNNDTICIIFSYLDVSDIIIICSSVNNYHCTLHQNKMIYKDHLLLNKKYYVDNWLPNYKVLDFHISHKLENPSNDIKYLTKICSKNKVYIDLLK